jgi:hypothetical protein
MPTPKMRERVPGARSLKERLGKNITDTDKHLQMGDVAASTATPTVDPDQPAGKKADLAVREFAVRRGFEWEK